MSFVFVEDSDAACRLAFVRRGRGLSSLNEQVFLSFAQRLHAFLRGFEDFSQELLAPLQRLHGLKAVSAIESMR